MNKRDRGDDDGGAGEGGGGDVAVPADKRARTAPSTALVAVDTSQALIVAATNPSARWSSLAAPTIQLTGHGGFVQALEFDPTGRHIASGSRDKRIFLWNVYGDCENYAVLEGHKNAVIDLHWSIDGSNIYSCSSDKTVAVWDAEYQRRVKKFTGHTSCINACSPLRRGVPLVASGADDCTLKVWDLRSRRCAHSIKHDYPITSVSFGPDATTVFTGGIDNEILNWDLRKEAVVWGLPGHTDTVTYLSLSPDGSHLLSNARDNTVRAWDVRPFVTDDRCSRVFVGGLHNPQCLLLGVAWAPNGERVAAASSNGNALVWDFDSSSVVYDLPGHKGGAVQVHFHPKEPILGSCGVDNAVLIGELAPTK